MTIETPTISAAEPVSELDEKVRSPLAFVAIFLLTFVVVLGYSFWVNVKVNPKSAFPNAVKPPSTDRGNHCLQLEQMVAAKNSPEVLVFGSSRTMQIRPFQVEMITGMHCFNFGVGGATALDAYTQLKYALALGVKPRMVILGIDEFAFNDTNNAFEGGLFSHQALFDQVPFPDNVTVGFSVLKTVSPESTWQATRTLLPKRAVKAANLNKKPVEHRADANIADHVLTLDGYFIYKSRAKVLAKGKYDLPREIDVAVKKWRVLPEENRCITVSPRLWEHFENFVELAQRNNIELKLMLLPVQPDYERRAFADKKFSNLIEERRELSARLQTFSKNRGVLFRDFTDISTYEGEPLAFWDQVHQQPYNLSKMINALFDLPPTTNFQYFPDDSLIVAHLEKLAAAKAPATRKTTRPSTQPRGR